MTLFVHFDKTDRRFVVNDGLHSIHDLSRDEYLLLMDDYQSGRHSATELFNAAARRHGEVS